MATKHTLLTWISFFGLGIIFALMPSLIDYIMEKYFRKHYPLNSGNKDFHSSSENENYESAVRSKNYF